jgi:hypothetical protein
MSNRAGQGPGRSTEDRFWSLVNGPWVDPRRGAGDCWEWMGATIGSRRPKSLAVNKPWKRYGRFWLPPRLVNAHRAALILTIGDPPDDSMVAGHRCDGSLCCNPSHLQWESQADNIAEAVARGRLVRVDYRWASTGAAMA